MFFSDFVGEPIGRADPLDPAFINACFVSFLRIRYVPDLSRLYHTLAFFVKSFTVSFLKNLPTHFFFTLWVFIVVRYWYIGILYFFIVFR